MTAEKFFHRVVIRNYKYCRANPSDWSALWNAIVSMNTVAEYIALERAGYVPIERGKLECQANDIRSKTQNLTALKLCAESLKHGRNIMDRCKKFLITAPSSGIKPEDQTTWTIHKFDLKELAQKALAELETFPELQ
jgi:hypothetical protein